MARLLTTGAIARHVGMPLSVAFIENELGVPPRERRRVGNGAYWLETDLLTIIIKLATWANKRISEELNNGR